MQHSGTPKDVSRDHVLQVSTIGVSKPVGISRLWGGRLSPAFYSPYQKVMQTLVYYIVWLQASYLPYIGKEYFYKTPFRSRPDALIINHQSLHCNPQTMSALVRTRNQDCQTDTCTGDMYSTDVFCSLSAERPPRHSL
jgi:hypothetical protein